MTAVIRTQLERNRSGRGRPTRRSPSRVTKPRLGARLRVRRVGELAELARQQVRDLLADIDRVIADPLERPRNEHHSQTVFAHPRRLAELEDPLDDAPVRAVDELVEIDERLGALEIALDERIERHTDHLLAARAHPHNTLDEALRRADFPLPLLQPSTHPGAI